MNEERAAAKDFVFIGLNIFIWFFSTICILSVSLWLPFMWY
jgi:hypothetical protein